MAGFVQIIEMQTSRIDEVEALISELRDRLDDGQSSSPRRGVMTADRDRQGYYLSVVEFESHEAAMENSSRPEVNEYSARLAKLCDSPPRFYNLDVREIWPPRNDAAGGRQRLRLAPPPRPAARVRTQQRLPTAPTTTLHQGSVQASRTVGRALAGQLVRDSPLLTAELATGIAFRRCDEDEGQLGTYSGPREGDRWMPQEIPQLCLIRTRARIDRKQGSCAAMAATAR
jgi:hypothetical protein